MHTYSARITWMRKQTEAFTDLKYSRRHDWVFDGGAIVSGSASPLNVKPPFSSPEAVDPEEALVAAASSCHMLFFLYLAAKRGFVVDEYLDDAEGVMEKNAQGKMAITRIALHPQVAFSGEKKPSAEEIAQLHESSHEECFIANSLKAEIVVISAAVPA